MPVFSLTAINPFGLTDVGTLAAPALADIDNDGDLDAFVGEVFNGTLFFRNTGTVSSPTFAAAVANPFGLSNVSFYANPTLADIDNDGDLDAFIGNADGNTLFYRNTGTVSSPAFAAAVTNPFGLSDAGTQVSPTFADIDNDGDLDAFIGNSDGNILFFRNTGTAGNPTFAAGIQNPFGLSDVGFLANPTFADNDGDGDLDAFIGNLDGNTLFFRNTGTATAPVFAAASTNPLGLSDVDSNASPVFVDIDNDGDLDAFVGNRDGNTLFFLNDSSAVFLASTAGNDILTGTAASVHDTVSYASAAGSVTVSLIVTTQQNTGGAGSDTLTNIENLTGSNFNDNLTGDGKNNVLNGMNGDDTLNGNAGADVMIGGLGNDTFVVSSTGDVVIEYRNEGIDKANSAVTYTLPVDVENLTLTGTLAVNGTGNGLNNVLVGNAAANRLNGGGGNDTLDGRAGADTMLGGLGFDNYVVDNVDDTITENPSEGTDKVSSSVTYTLPANVENLLLTGATAINGTGNNLANSITGNSANNQLNGGGGNDILDGSTGTNTFTGGAGADIFRITTAGHIDTITDYNVAADTIQLENAVFTALMGTGVLAASRFRVGAQALDANDFIIYNSTTGALLYDADGNGAGAAVQIATLGAGLSMTNADIVVI
ncbi:FG-GAP-like repeat-containing protein [Nitrosomonas sp. Nm166]|uniref:FG-GAP-like repeat-containing protein n=1 Tax=Nitrosomonas sp. Nm166 TaxID=1881054 RepID=UPI0008F00B2C|nr:FG-GAP-like repeat-containing protein [Nitrosomonas sp. Nm166]SFE67839.1 Hemolysin-type calcium-binding repeat-containing protein [Nitrosomonas sp. Nm166]